LLVLCQILDGIIFIFSKSTKKNYPLGYLFQGNK
jgi:hypothetical protein